MKRRFSFDDDVLSSSDEDSSWNPSDDDEEDGEAASCCRKKTRSQGPADAVEVESSEAMDKIDETVDQESDFSSSTEVFFLCVSVCPVHWLF